MLPILVGLQVDDWNTARLERKEEQVYLQRLHVDLADYIQAFNDSKKSLETHNKNLTSFSDALYGRDPRAELTNEECIAVTASDILGIYAPGLPVLDEIISSGRMYLFRNDELRTAIVAFQQARESTLQLIDASVVQSFNLPVNYPELIQPASYYDESEKYVRTAPTCNLEGLRSNQGFKNEASTNLDIYDTFINKRVVDFGYALENLKKLLDADR